MRFDHVRLVGVVMRRSSGMDSDHLTDRIPGASSWLSLSLTLPCLRLRRWCRYRSPTYALTCWNCWLGGDGRSNQGRDHPVSVELALAAAAVVAGMKGLYRFKTQVAG